MATPAVGLHPHVSMAFITKLFLVGITVHTRILKADKILLAAHPLIYPIALANGGVPPMVQELHMFRPHEILRLHTVLIFGSGLALTVPIL
jgi:hypothetical protein